MNMAVLRRRACRPLGLLLVVTLAPLTVVDAASSAIPVTSVFAQDRDMAMSSGGGYEQVEKIAVPATGVAEAYPSTVEASGLQGVVRDVVVTLMGVTHPNPEDLDVMLVSPNGRRAVVMSDVGGSDDVANLTIHLDDEAYGPLPDSNIHAESGQSKDERDSSHAVYQPRNAGAGADTFPAPAPQTTENSSLSVFDGTDPNGVWRLFVVDDGAAAGPNDAIGSWHLQIFTTSDPYPSTVEVSGVRGRVIDLDVTLTGLTHEAPADIDMLLVGPQGEQATVMSDNGGSRDVSDLVVTLDDESTNTLPDEFAFSGPIRSGTYRPGNQVLINDEYWPPAPASTGKTALGAFDGTDPNGTWRLFVNDDNLCGAPNRCPDASPWLPAEGYLGTLAGWQLDIRWADNAAPSGAVSVAGGATATGSTTVTLGVSATDPAPGEGVTRMRFSNDGSTFSPFRPYATSAAWDLLPGDGPRTVYAQFSDGAGNLSPVVSDTITLAIAPRATRVKPAARAKHVRTGATLKVFATEPLAARTVIKRHVRLTKKGSSRAIRAKVHYLFGKQMVRVEPKQRLAPDTTYRVTLRTRVTDLAGNRWDQVDKPGAQPLRWTFTTRPARRDN